MFEFMTNYSCFNYCSIENSVFHSWFLLYGTCITVWRLIKWNILIAKWITEHPSWWKSNDFDVAISSNLNCIVMKKTSCTNCIRDTGWIKWALLSLNIGRYGIYFGASCLCQYTSGGICVETYTILYSIKVTIYQIHCKTTIYLMEMKKKNNDTLLASFYTFVMKHKFTSINAFIRRIHRIYSQYPVAHVKACNGFTGLIPTRDAYKIINRYLI